MPYTRTQWQNEVTKLNSNNLNNMEDGIEEALAIASEASKEANNANIKANKASQDVEFLRSDIADTKVTKETIIKALGYTPLDGDYNDLTNKPAIPTKITDLENDSNFANKDELFSKSYNDLTDKPTIPNKISQLTNDSNFANKDDLFSKDYNELINKPSIPAKVSQLTNDSNFVSKNYVDQKVADLINAAPETLDTLGEIAKGIKDNSEVINTLNNAISNKANKEEVYTKVEMDALLGNISIALSKLVTVEVS